MYICIDKTHCNTVEPWLSESPLSEPWLSEHYFKFENPKRRLDLLQNQVINETPIWFLELLGLLYHSTVGKKAY